MKSIRSTVEASALVVKEVMCFLVKPGHVLLGRRLSRRAVGTISGFGGKLLEDEAAEVGLIREVEEECGLRCRSARHLALLRILAVDADLRVVDAYAAEVFWCSEYDGSLVSSLEMLPFWCRVNEIPYAEMWNSDVHWLPLAILGHRCTVRIVRDCSTEKALSTFVIAEEVDQHLSAVLSSIVEVK